MKSFLFFFFCPFLLYAQTDTGKIQSDTVYAQMKAVVFKSSGSFIKNETDKTIVQIEGRASLSGMNALEILRQSPGVMVDPNENIGMGGKTGVLVYIDDKPSQLSGQDLAQVLKSIDAGNIRSIELINNPSARFDAAGNAGIINIKLKKSLSNGLNGSINGAHVQSTHSRQNIGSNLNFRKNNLNLFWNGSGYRGLQHTIANTDRVLKGADILQRSIEKDRFHGASIRTGIDYRINKFHTAGITWMHNRKYSGMDNQSNSVFLKKTGAMQPVKDSSVTTRSIAPFENNRNSFNLNYSFEKNKTKLVLDADHIRYGSFLNNELFNLFKDEEELAYKNTSTRFDQSVKIRVNSLKMDLFKEINQWKIESGFKYLNTSSDNIILVKDKLQNQWVVDTLQTNFFDFRENIAALYASVNKDFKKITIQLGMRAEYSKIKGQSADLLSSIQNKPDTAYLNFFPTVYLSYRINPDHTIGLVANRRIDRPAYQDQNPFIYALDAFNYEQGNPYLTPQYSNAVELSYTYKYASSIKIKFSGTRNYIEQLIFQDGQKTVMVPQNAGSRKMLNIVISTPLKIQSWWNLYGYAEPYFQVYKVDLESFGTKARIENKGWGFNSYLSNTFTLPKKWKLDISYWFNYQNTTTIYTSKPISSLNLGIQKMIAKDKMVLKLAVTDIFNDQKWEQSARNSNLNLVSYRKWESRNITIGMSFRFGNEKIKAARDRNMENTERISDSR